MADAGVEWFDVAVALWFVGLDEVHSEPAVSPVGTLRCRLIRVCRRNAGRRDRVHGGWLHDQ